MMQPHPDTPFTSPGDEPGDRRDAALAAAAAATARIVAAERAAAEDAADFVTVDLSAMRGGRSCPVMHALFDVRERTPVLLLMVRGQ